MARAAGRESGPGQGGGGRFGSGAHIWRGRGRRPRGDDGVEGAAPEEAGPFPASDGRAAPGGCLGIRAPGRGVDGADVGRPSHRVGPDRSGSGTRPRARGFGRRSGRSALSRVRPGRGRAPSGGSRPGGRAGRGQWRSRLLWPLGCRRGGSRRRVSPAPCYLPGGGSVGPRGSCRRGRSILGAGGLGPRGRRAPC